MDLYMVTLAQMKRRSGVKDKSLTRIQRFRDFETMIGMIQLRTLPPLKLLRRG